MLSPNMRNKTRYLLLPLLFSVTLEVLGREIRQERKERQAGRQASRLERNK